MTMWTAGPCAKPEKWLTCSSLWSCLTLPFPPKGHRPGGSPLGGPSRRSSSPWQMRLLLCAQGAYKDGPASFSPEPHGFGDTGLQLCPLQAQCLTVYILLFRYRKTHRSGAGCWH